jgi:undecaprenyl-phosphate 4-deoxy-4-formamido-L-arabinose transferase
MSEDSSYGFQEGLSQNMRSVSIVIPVFNAELTLHKLIGQLTAALPTMAESYEIILVDDCSRDCSWEHIKALKTNHKFVRGIRLGRNYGQHNALLCGIRAANFETVVTMDDDLQNPVSEISKLLGKLEDGFDVVYGTPEQQQHGMLRNMASSLTKLALQSVMGAETARKVSAFRAFRTRLRGGFENYSGPYVSVDVLLTWSTSNFASLIVAHVPREAGSSNYSFRKLISHALDLMTGFSTLPLQLASILGFVFTFFGLGTLVWVLGKYLFLGTSVPGFPFLASIIAIFSGVQLFALGVYGEYLARIHFRTMAKPSYLVSETTMERGE